MKTLILSKKHNRDSNAKELQESKKLLTLVIYTLGEVAEWLNVTVSKTVVRLGVPWVRIPPSPQDDSPVPSHTVLKAL